MADGPDLTTARIRALQAIYQDAHEALRNWGLWSLDLRKVYPTQKPPSTFRDYRSGEDYGDEDLALEPTRLDAPAKAEAAPREPYDQKTAEVLDERIHAPGGLPVEIRTALRVAYVSRETIEPQWPGFAGCNLDAFCERLESGLRFARRFC